MSLASLVARLKSESVLQATEGVLDAKLETWITESIAKHSPQYDADTLPDEEVEAVVVLAWIQLCYLRAAKHASTPDTVGANSLGANRDSIYRRQMDMAKQLEMRYGRIVAQHESPDSGNITQGKLVKKSDRTDRTEGALVRPISLTLASGEVLSTSAVLKWTSREIPDFADYYIFVSTSENIREEWNFTGRNGVRQIANHAELLDKVSDFEIKSVKAEDMEPNTEYFFLIVAWTTRNVFHYSNELRVQTAA